MTIRRILICGLAVTALWLSACSNYSPNDAAQTPSAAESNATPTPTPSTDQGYATLTDLRDAAADAGYPCPKWTQDNVVTNASASGSCTDSDVFSLYANDTMLQKQIATTQSTDKTMKDAGIAPGFTLVGPNWMINLPAKYLDSIHKALGGTEVSKLTSSAEPSTNSTDTTTWEGDPADFEVSIKIKKKQCFGSAGCIVTYQIYPSYTGLDPLPTKGIVEVTYEVKGDESGPSVNTFTVDGEGTAHFDSAETARTPSAKTSLKAKVTDVSYDPNATQ